MEVIMTTEQLITQIILTVSICMITGLLVTRLVRLLNLPDVTAYLLAGVLVGTFCLGGVSLGGYYLGYNEHVFAANETLDVVLTAVCNLALGFIAFAIGSEFRWSSLKKTGKEATVIGILQAVITTLLVDAALIGFHFLAQVHDILNDLTVEQAAVLLEGGLTQTLGAGRRHVGGVVVVVDGLRQLKDVQSLLHLGLVGQEQGDLTVLAGVVDVAVDVLVANLYVGVLAVAVWCPKRDNTCSVVSHLHYELAVVESVERNSFTVNCSLKIRFVEQRYIRHGALWSLLCTRNGKNCHQKGS